MIRRPPRSTLFPYTTLMDTLLSSKDWFRAKSRWYHNFHEFRLCWHAKDKGVLQLSQVYRQIAQIPAWLRNGTLPYTTCQRANTYATLGSTSTLSGRNLALFGDVAKQSKSLLTYAVHVQGNVPCQTHNFSACLSLAFKEGIPNRERELFMGSHWCEPGGSAFRHLSRELRFA